MNWLLRVIHGRSSGRLLRPRRRPAVDNSTLIMTRAPPCADAHGVDSLRTGANESVCDRGRAPPARWQLVLAHRRPFYGQQGVLRWEVARIVDKKFYVSNGLSLRLTMNRPDLVGDFRLSCNAGEQPRWESATSLTGRGRRRTPDGRSRCWSMSSMAERIVASAGPTWARNCSPAAESDTLRVVRSNNRTPTRLRRLDALSPEKPGLHVRPLRAPGPGLKYSALGRYWRFHTEPGHAYQTCCG
jgi:hypothetical protein